jgi:cytidylate kinase
MKKNDIPSVIAIDGPAASGKSTLARMLAENLGYLFFDTGVMYRAITWVALQKGILMDDESTIEALAERAEIDVQPPSKNDGRLYDVWIDDRDITWQIRQTEVDANVSIVSAYPGVRKALTSQQRRIGQRGRVVMVGRDIGTVVLPEADLKIYLDASVEERARRRTQEIIERGGSADYGTILGAMRARDRIDTTRSVAPLKPAEDAVIINTDGLSLPRVLDYVLTIIELKMSQDKRAQESRDRYDAHE